jgi:hypothetical protein
MTAMSHLPAIDWDYADRMKHANKNTGGGDVFGFAAKGHPASVRVLVVRRAVRRSEPRRALRASAGSRD